MRKLLFFAPLIVAIAIFGAEVKIKDVSPVLDIYEPVSFMIENKIMDLDENGNFRGGLLVTRFDIAQYLYNILSKFQLRDISDKLGNLEKNQQNLSTKIMGIEAAYKTYEQRLKDFEMSVASLQSQTDKLSQQIYAQLHKEIEEILNQHQNQISRLEPVLSRVEALEKLASSLQKSIESTDSNLNLLSSKIAELQANQTEFSRSFSNSENLLNSLLKNVNENSQSIQKLSEQFNVQMNAQGKLYDQKITELAARLDALSKGLQNDLSIQKKQLTDFQQNLELYNSRVTQLQQDMKTIESLASKDELSHVQDSITSLNQKIEEIDVNLTQLEQKMEDTQVGMLQKKIGELETKQKNLESSVLTAYLIGAAGVAIGLIAVLFQWSGQ
ncbi:S-layer homology domain-containing protein [Pseudothermotoga elfii]|uniref:S-layer homology domain-containing protein n=1 Tax=Pseudothermotoga elfii TaxID=38322 RepID=UPI0003FEDAAF|nr:S-layer homology domain-containing protein [Pseudothermotoga elfii]